jgi:hypothetical protein
MVDIVSQYYLSLKPMVGETDSDKQTTILKYIIETTTMSYKVRVLFGYGLSHTKLIHDCYDLPGTNSQTSQNEISY